MPLQINVQEAQLSYRLENFLALKRGVYARMARSGLKLMKVNAIRIQTARKGKEFLQASTKLYLMERNSVILNCLAMNTSMELNKIAISKQR